MKNYIGYYNKYFMYPHLAQEVIPHHHPVWSLCNCINQSFGVGCP